MTGTVYLVGAGPGDPGLLTRRGAELLAGADVVVHDRLTGPALLSLAPPTAEMVDVGKQPDDRGDQEAINQLLVARARGGLNVVRLKGGDPYVFGRGGEEALALQAAGIPFVVVPGVSAAIAAPAVAGVPVTHRGLVTAFTVVAGHTRSVGTTPAEGGTNWEALAAVGGTIVVLMGAAHRHRIAERLMAGGMSPATPVLAVQWGTEPQQASVRTTLAGLSAITLGPPLTMVIGEVAGLDLRSAGPLLPSGEPLPLAGKTVVVTRAALQASPLAHKLRRLGARVLEVPTIAFAPPADNGQSLLAALDGLKQGAYAWTVFSSANAVERFFEHVPDTRLLATTKVAVVGPGTAGALGAYRVVADLVPTSFRAEGLAAAFPDAPPPPAPTRVLLPQAAGARPELSSELSRRGWDVHAVEAYRTVPQELEPAILAAAGAADAVCFASSSAVNSYLDQAGTAPLPPVVACIGPVTAATARSRGLQVHAEASEHTLDGLVTALVSTLSSA